MKPLDQLEPETKANAVKALGLREQNSKIINRLENMAGGSSVEVTVARLEHFIDQLVGYGVITDDEMWTIHLDWETNLNNQLVQVEVKARREIQRVREEQARQDRNKPVVVQNPKVIFGPGGQVLSSEQT